MKSIIALLMPLISAHLDLDYINSEYKKWIDDKNNHNITIISDSTSITFKSYVYVEPTNYVKYTLPNVYPRLSDLSIKDIYYTNVKLNTYNKAREYMYSYTDNIDGFIFGLYSNKSMYVGNDMKGIRDRAYNGRKGFSAEHVYPKSLLPTSKSKNDIHNLYPTDAYFNTRRSVYRYEDLTDDEKLNGIKFSESYLNNKRWEPKHSSKGNIARAVAYVMMMYEPETPIMDIDTMKKWNTEDPVDQYDIDRNNKIYEVQNNFNPFILYPNLMDLVF